jgi:tripartite-type tricarboxylate transporter receptor subunit TctC
MPEILTEIMAGRVDFTCSTIATALPFIREDKLVALAVSTPAKQ